MTASKPRNRHDGESITANDNERDLGLVRVAMARRRQASKAGQMWALYTQSHAKKYMNFQQFQKPSVRNTILAGYGLEPLKYQLDRTPRRKRNRKVQRSA